MTKPRYKTSRKGAGNPAPTEAAKARLKGDKPRKRVQIQVDPNLLAELDERRDKTSRSDVINDLIKHWLIHNEPA